MDGSGQTPRTHRNRTYVEPRRRHTRLVAALIKGERIERGRLRSNFFILLLSIYASLQGFQDVIYCDIIQQTAALKLQPYKASPDNVQLFLVTAEKSSALT
jgi:hypothetical protein